MVHREEEKKRDNAERDKKEIVCQSRCGSRVMGVLHVGIISRSPVLLSVLVTLPHFLLRAFFLLLAFLGG